MYSWNAIWNKNRKNTHTDNRTHAHKNVICLQFEDNKFPKWMKFSVINSFHFGFFFLLQWRLFLMLSWMKWNDYFDACNIFRFTAISAKSCDQIQTKFINCDKITKYNMKILSEFRKQKLLHRFVWAELFGLVIKIH